MVNSNKHTEAKWGLTMERKKYVSLTKEKGEPIEELLVRISRRQPIEFEEKIGTLDKPMILECACPGGRLT
jgi:hypothetical protein